MKNPLSALLERCSRGFTLSQKLGITVLCLLWVVSPLDLDFLPLIGWIDDVMVLDMLRRVWMAPLLPRPDGDGAPTPQPTASRMVHAQRPSPVRREHVGGVR